MRKYVKACLIDRKFTLTPNVTNSNRNDYNDQAMEFYVDDYLKAAA